MSLGTSAPHRGPHFPASGMPHVVPISAGGFGTPSPPTSPCHLCWPCPHSLSPHSLVSIAAYIPPPLPHAFSCVGASAGGRGAPGLPRWGASIWAGGLCSPGRPLTPIRNSFLFLLLLACHVCRARGEAANWAPWWPGSSSSALPSLQLTGAWHSYSCPILLAYKHWQPAPGWGDSLPCTTEWGVLYTNLSAHWSVPVLGAHVPKLAEKSQ